jgi:hypothetical protein
VSNFSKNDLVLPAISSGIFSSDSLKIGVKNERFSMKTDSNETVSEINICLAG